MYDGKLVSDLGFLEQKKIENSYDKSGGRFRKTHNVTHNVTHCTLYGHFLIQFDGC